MPRRNRSPRRIVGGTRQDAAEPVRATSVSFGEREETWRNVAYRVRAVSGSGNAGPYRCPGCDQLLSSATPHVVAWPADDVDAEDRRHWHTACWSARERRGPNVQRSRNAPRYS